jgi:hypothetical protein
MTRDLTFYRNLPKKECTECGKQLEEQAESYRYECECRSSHKNQ